MSDTPDLKKIEQTLKRMTPEQFSALCAELGLVEDLLGKTRDEQIKTLLGLSSANLNRVVRAVRHVWPHAFEPPPVKPRREFKLPIGPVVGLIALIVIIAAGSPSILAVAMIAYFSNFSAGLTHYGTTPGPIFFGAGYVSQQTWWKLGLLASVFGERWQHSR